NLVDHYAVQDIKKAGASALKLLVYYDHMEKEQYNSIKNAFIKRVGDECKQNDMLFILEPVSYSAEGLDAKGADFAKKKPANVAFFMEEFSKSEYGVDVLKVEVPVAIYHIEGHGKNAPNAHPVFSESEAAACDKECSDKSMVPFIYLSGCVKNGQVIDTIHIAKKAGSTFSRSHCGRENWKYAVEACARMGHDNFYKWLKNTSAANLKNVHTAIVETAT